MQARHHTGIYVLEISLSELQLFEFPSNYVTNDVHLAIDMCIHYVPRVHNNFNILQNLVTEVKRTP